MDMDFTKSPFIGWFEYRYREMEEKSNNPGIVKIFHSDAWYDEVSKGNLKTEDFRLSISNRIWDWLDQ